MSLPIKNEMVFVTAKVAAKPEFAEPVKQACLALTEISRKETGCVFYSLFQAADAPHVFIFFEKWKTAQDLENHLASKHAAEFDSIVEDLLLEDEEITYLKRII